MSELQDAAAEAIARLRPAVEAAGSVQQVLDAVVDVVDPSIPLVRAAIRRLDDVMVEVVAVWTRTPTAIGRGTKMSVSATSFPTVLTTGRPVISTVGDGRLLDDILRTEGVASYVTLPLRQRGMVAGLLSLSSGSVDAFSDEDLPFLEAIAAAVEGRIAALLGG